MRIAMSVTAVAALASVAGAQVVNHNFSNGTIQVTQALTGFMTFGDDMDGMTVRATFADGFTQSLTWADTGAGAGGVGGAGWSLDQSGDTFSSPWTLVNSRNFALVRLAFDSAPNTVFDTDSPVGGGFGTDGSFSGTDLSIVAGPTSLDLNVSYTDAVRLLANALPVGDLYRTMVIDFRGDGLFGTMRYRQDTDNTLLSDLRPIPLPSVAGLGFAGLLAVGAGRRCR